MFQVKAFQFPSPIKPSRKIFDKHPIKKKSSGYSLKLSFQWCGGGGFLICIWSVAKLIHGSLVYPDGVAGEAQREQIRTVLRT
jgi:hypothetical protein